MGHTTVKCKKCDAVIVPRLWHYGGGIFTYMTTQHICPICGSVMYETGGDLRQYVWYGALLISIVFTYGATNQFSLNGFIIGSAFTLLIYLFTFPSFCIKFAGKLLEIATKSSK